MVRSNERVMRKEMKHFDFLFNHYVEKKEFAKKSLNHDSSQMKRESHGQAD